MDEQIILPSGMRRAAVARRRGQVCRPIADDAVADSLEHLLGNITALQGTSKELVAGVVYINRLITYVRDAETREKRARRSAEVQAAKARKKEKQHGP